MAPVSIYEVAEAEDEAVPSFSTGKPKRKRHFRWWRFLTLLIVGAYILIPLYAGIKFSLQNDTGGFSTSRTRAFLPRRDLPAR